MAQVFCSLGFIAFEHGKRDEAEDWYEKALALDGSSTTALNGLGYVLADGGSDLTRALTLCKKACDADPENPAYLDSLGWVYCKLGLENEARTYTRRARDHAPDNEVISRHLSEIAEMRGKR